MNSVLTDDEIDSMLGTDYGFDDDQTSSQAALAPPAQPPRIEPVPLFPLAAATQPVPPQNGGASEVDQGVLRKKYAGVPAWAWGLLGIGVVGSGYMLYRSKKVVSKNGSDDEETPGLGDIVSKALASGGSSANDATAGRGWEPSRTSFAQSLERYFKRKGLSDQVTVWVDAEDAKEKGGMKFVSPLVNVQVRSGAAKVDEALKRHCRREGLDPRQHPDGSIGLYPHSSKRGKEWEEYIDALRDEGQSV